VGQVGGVGWWFVLALGVGVVWVVGGLGRLVGSEGGVAGFDSVVVCSAVGPIVLAGGCGWGGAVGGWGWLGVGGVRAGGGRWTRGGGGSCRVLHWWWLAESSSCPLPWSRGWRPRWWGVAPGDLG